MPAERNKTINELLTDAFVAKHVNAAVGHFKGMVEEFETRRWDNASTKGGKFIEAVLKALLAYVGDPVPAGKHFKAGTVMTVLENKPASPANPDVIRLTIPRACRFGYEIASNRGARHDPDEIDANETDARTVLALCAWILAEMVRYSQKGKTFEPAQAAVEGLTRRRYPFVEDIDGRIYANIGKSAPEVALVILYAIYPKPMSRDDLIEAVVRHSHKRHNAEVAVSRIKPFIDDDGKGMLRLRATGVQKVEELIASARAADE